GDVACCFYQFVLPPHLREAFGLPPVPSAALPPVARRAAGAPPPDGLVRLRLRVVRMGWSWTVYFVQQAMQRILGDVVPADYLLAECMPRAPVQPGSGVSLIYVDNFAALATSQEEAGCLLEEMLAAVAAAGAEAGPGPQGSPLLGFELDSEGTRWRPSARKFWRVALALRALGWGKTRRAERQIARVVGNASAIVLLRLEMLSPARVWASVGKELRAAWALLPLALVDVNLPWSPSAASVGASLHGFGVTEKDWDAAELLRPPCWLSATPYQ
ncbi:unnamed protein product, partial [Prorocentrum cordatum]